MKKNKEKKEKKSFIYDLRIFVRGMKINYRLDPVFFWMQVVNACGDSIRTFLNAIITALIINGVNEGKPQNTLIRYAIIVVILNFIVNLSVLFTANRRYIRKSMWEKYISLFFNSYSEKMDYECFEDVKIRDQRNRINQYIQSWEGISNFWAWYHIVSGTTALISSVAVVSTIFISMGKGYAPGTIYAFADSIWAVILFIIITALYTVFCAYHQKKLNILWNNYYEDRAKIARKWWQMRLYPSNTKLSIDMNIYGLSKVVHKEHISFSDKSLSLYKKTNQKQLLLDLVDIFATFLFRVFVYGFVIVKAFSGAFGIGLFVLYTTTMMRIGGAFRDFAYSIGKIRGSRKVYEDEFDYIDRKRKSESGTESPDFIRKEHVVEFRNVSFKYPGSEDYQLKNVSIKFGFNERLAIVGMNGSGKTTFIKLLCRLYDPEEGEIFLDGKNIKEYDAKEYRKMFSVVFQDFKLFSFPVAENIAASKKYDAERVKRCLEEAGIAERVSSMPNGIETCIYRGFDANGIEISGGEAQKLAIARALYKDSPIMILDEPTAALDPIAESEVYSHFNEMVEGKTAVYISHRLSSCKFCDRIAVFDKGELIQLGTHKDLVNDEKGKYYELWNAQAQYYT